MSRNCACHAHQQGVVLIECMLDAEEIEMIRFNYVMTTYDGARIVE